MKKTYCDICGKEIENVKRVVIDDIYLEDVCEECTKILRYCMTMITKCKWKPDFHEVRNSDDMRTRDAADRTLYKLEQLLGKIK